MRILFSEPDTFGRVGGGETVVSNLVRARPGWHFVNPSRLPSPARPAFENAEVVALHTRIDMGAAYHAAAEVGRWHRYDYEDAINATNLAWTFRGQAFDVVEVPDYVSYGRFLPAAFAEQDVRVGRFVQSLHGRLSTTYEYEWFKIGQPPNEYDAAKRRAEDLSLNVADVRYGLSEFYKRELRERTRLPIELIDPLLCVEVPDVDALPPFASGTEPQLVFVSRLERRKAADRFIDLLWYLGDKAPRTRLLIGSEVRLGGTAGKGRVEAHQRHRHVDNITYLPGLTPAELKDRVYRQASVVVLPTRYDTFNLTALESVLHGCPVLLGRNCGALEYLQATFPGAAVIAFDEDDVAASAAALGKQIHCFGDARRATIEAVRRAAPEADASSIVRAFEAPSAFDPAVRAVVARDFDDICRTLTDLVGGLSISALDAWRATPNGNSRPAQNEVDEHEMDAIRALTKKRSHFRTFSRQPAFWQPDALSPFAVMEDFAPAQELMRRAGLLRGQRALDVLARAAAVPTPSTWATLSDGDRDRRAADVRGLLKQSPAWLRTRLTLALADAEAASGRDLLAAAYRFRALRWLGDDRFGLSRSIVATAAGAGLGEEAKAVEFCRQSLSTEGDEAGVACYLQSRFDALRRIGIPADEAQRTDARRKERYRVSVLVSMYTVAPPALDRFVQMLGTLTMVRRGEAEIVFIDSGSPSPQWPLLAGRLKALGADYVCVRTAARETIQSAWNRGVTLARGEYLACLGTDEALHPEALDVLAGTLDEQPSVDWAMGDSVVTSVDARGVHLDDKMAYLRSGNWSEASLLFDCTYLSYVGGLYRRSVHDRFGFYDPTFGGAGDTEFKCRIHPFINTVHVPRTLGAFLDYPAERVTASYRVELEDARAWYLFRTSGGIRYLFQNADPVRLERAFWGMLANRRAFTNGPESDVQFALRLLPLLRERDPRSPALAHEPAVRQLLGTARALGWQADWSIEGFRQTAGRLQSAESTFAEFGRCHPERAFPTGITSDAQFFAHAWVWE